MTRSVAAALSPRTRQGDGDAPRSDHLVGNDLVNVRCGDPGQEGTDLSVTTHRVRSAERGVVPILDPFRVLSVEGNQAAISLASEAAWRAGKSNRIMVGSVAIGASLVQAAPRIPNRPTIPAETLAPWLDCQ